MMYVYNYTMYLMMPHNFINEQVIEVRGGK